MDLVTTMVVIRGTKHAPTDLAFGSVVAIEISVLFAFGRRALAVGSKSAIADRGKRLIVTDLHRDFRLRSSARFRRTARAVPSRCGRRASVGRFVKPCRSRIRTSSWMFFRSRPVIL